MHGAVTAEPERAHVGAVGDQLHAIGPQRLAIARRRRAGAAGVAVREPDECAAAARELALMIRKMQPGLPQTQFDRCKVRARARAAAVCCGR